jgi:tetratricopeptide (TPR) repeat protein
MRFATAVLAAGVFLAGCRSGELGMDVKGPLAFEEIKKGDKAVEAGDLDTAIKHYEKALELAPAAPRWRFAYAQLLYWKGLSYSQESHHKWQQTMGNTFDFEMGKWTKLGHGLSQEEKKGLLEKSAQEKRQSVIYFNKALKQLMICDHDMNYAFEAVPFAMGIIYVFLEDHDKAIVSFERILASSRVSEDYRQKVAKAVDQIKKYKQEQELEKKPYPGIETPAP